MNKHINTNDLIHETSPYLLQHAHNPVDWKPWNNEIIDLAKKENKLIIISIGYSSCHWCHVMEHESFEDLKVAEVMNKNFINIKIDREERPDIDQVYMSAVQIMTGRGGWPLNCIALPDGRPIWGGTYFKKKDWINVLEQLAKMYHETPQKAIEYAVNLTEGVKQSSLISINNNNANFNKSELEKTVSNWQKKMDSKFGGINRPPKFPLPNNYQFLLRYGFQTQNKELLSYVNTTLTKMAYGGIFDQIGGGFSRYSTDIKWHVPHFEKMLYDNAQLVSLYADAYLLTKNNLYKDVAYETLDFVKNELTTDEGAFYSALDADSLTEDDELEEGAFYVWTIKELEKELKEDYTLFETYYNINNFGFWENDNYVLIRNKSDEEIVQQFNISLSELNLKKEHWKKTLLKIRNKRNKPRLDDKTLTSWNALMLKGYVDAYRVFNNQEFLNAALKNAKFLFAKQFNKDGGLNHNYKDGKSTINGYLEDYATVIDAYISLYEITFNEFWLKTAKNLTDYVYDHFYDDTSKMFFFTSDLDAALITRKIEVDDNVIPASNSIMAKNLFKLSHYYSNNYYAKTSTQMLNNVTNRFEQYGSGYSNWMQLYCDYIGDFYAIAISGDNATEKLKEINNVYLPNKIIAGSNKKSNLPLLQNRFKEQETFIYVCLGGACQLPTSNSKTAISQIKTTF